MSSNHNSHVNRIHDLDSLLAADLSEDLTCDVENERLTGTLPTTVAALKRRLEDCIGSEDYVAVIRALAATRDPAAIRVLASLLDSVGPIAEESIAGLLTFGRRAGSTPALPSVGEAVVRAMRECTDSLDYDMIRHGHEVLARLGDETSKQWLRADRRERAAAIRERVQFPRVEMEDPVANETDEERNSA